MAKRLPAGCHNARCHMCHAKVLVVQPTIQVILGIPPALDNALCEECQDIAAKRDARPYLSVRFNPPEE